LTDEAFDPETLDFYANEAPVYAASGPGGASRHLSRFLDQLAPGARVLELGCGGGRDAEAMIARGFVVDPTDGSAALAAEAGRRLNRPVRVLRFDELDADATYDAVWAAACLLHVPRIGLPKVLARVHRALKPRGLHFASYKSLGAQGRDSFGRLFNHLTAAELVAAYDRSAAWDLVALEEYTGGGYDQRQGPWVAVTMRRVR
jgi:SAM-dependent methyltransferase